MKLNLNSKYYLIKAYFQNLQKNVFHIFFSPFQDMFRLNLIIGIREKIEKKEGSRLRSVPRL